MVASREVGDLPRCGVSYFLPVPPFLTSRAALVLFVPTGSGVDVVTVAVFRIVPTLPFAWAQITNVTVAPASRFDAVHRT